MKFGTGLFLIKEITIIWAFTWTFPGIRKRAISILSKSHQMVNLCNWWSGIVFRKDNEPRRARRNTKMKKKTVSLTTNFSWWNKEKHPVLTAVLTASGFKFGKPLKRLMSCFGFSSHWLKPVVNESRSTCEFINLKANTAAKPVVNENFQIYKSSRLDALISSRYKKNISVS